MQIILANPRGLCAGVIRAIDIVNKLINKYKKKIYIKHEIVHNKFIVNKLKKKGVVFVEKISNVPKGEIIIFSAHGVSKKDKKEAKIKNLKIFDATCPLVLKIHSKVIQASKKGTEIILIGHHGHPEVIGTIGQYTNNNAGIYLIQTIKDIKKLKIKNKQNLKFVTQTTLSVENTNFIVKELKKKYPEIKNSNKNDICYATTNRQKAVKILSKKTDIVIVIGSRNSSNANRLAEIVHNLGNNVKLVDNEKDIKKSWFKNIKKIGITSGASTPEILVNQVIKKLFTFGIKDIKEIYGKKEEISFKIPKKIDLVNLTI
ncbi:4-hydroxy-3-methylbut-2-enyl diphosphate reductase [Buchnera aphidicola (Neophyllaphis podocarpi)]|uniref:4-hydroxy-3-methylbut-2-enyl diphosphate reductase n=1 Tax=Buchnera aphidicola TaxID=9 RepID=UPI0031B8AE81